jgi:drug/metabolite transporter (DMT)-like permease
MIFCILFSFAVLRGINAVTTKVAQKDYVNNLNGSVYLTVLYCFFQAIFLIAIPPYSGLTFKTEFLTYPLLYSVFYFISFILFINALGQGPASLSNIIYNFQLLIPVLLGLVIWKESITLYQLVGLLLFGIILFIFNKSSYNEGGVSKRPSVRWAFLSIGSAVAVGIAIIFTKQYMVDFNGFIKEYLLIANIIIVLIGLPYLGYTAVNKKLSVRIDLRFILLVATAALIQDITNIIYMHYITKYSSAYFFPMIGILNIVSIVLMNRFLLKERMAAKAYIGIIISFAAIYLLGIK